MSRCRSILCKKEMDGIKCILDYLRIASFMFLDENGRQVRREVSSVLSNKFLTLLNVRLKEQQGFDMKLSIAGTARAMWWRGRCSRTSTGSAPTSK